MAADRPWMKFYPQDWRADERLRNCSMAARGLWIEMLAIMHRSEHYGYLLINGRAPTDRQLANQVGASTAEVSPLIAELEAEAVFSRDKDDTIYSRRMERDDEKHRKASNFGKRGVRAKARKDKEETPPLKGSLEDTHEGTHQLRGQSPDNPPVSPKLKGQGSKRLLPDDWEPEPFGDGTISRSIVDGWDEDRFAYQLEAFRAHHRRDGNRYSDWQQAWSTWVLNSRRFAERDDAGGRSSGRPKSLVEIILAEGNGQPP